MQDLQNKGQLTEEIQMQLMMQNLSPEQLEYLQQQQMQYQQ